MNVAKITWGLNLSDTFPLVSWECLLYKDLNTKEKVDTLSKIRKEFFSQEEKLFQSKIQEGWDQVVQLYNFHISSDVSLQDREVAVHVPIYIRH